MKCYLVRHGRDDDSVRGGWSNSPLTTDGIKQVEILASHIHDIKLNVDVIYTSDLPRARQTAEIIADSLKLPVTEMPQFRETNNGALAGMDNELAKKLYPGLYWSSLDWEQAYPDGESPCDFFTRINFTWCSFKELIKKGEKSAILVTHGGVINVIRCIEAGIQYSNKETHFKTANAEMIELEI